MNPAPKVPDDAKYSGRLAGRLRSLREKAGISVEQAVEGMAAAGYPIGVQTYYGWENGRRQPNWDAVPALATCLGVGIRTLIPSK